MNLESERRSAPRLVIGVSHHNITDADGTKVNIFASPQLSSALALCTMLTNLLAVYYVWDLVNHRQYQLLLFLRGGEDPIPTRCRWLCLCPEWISEGRCRCIGMAECAV